METLSDVPSFPTVILLDYSAEQMKLAQEEEPVIKQLQIALQKSSECPYTQMDTSSSSLLSTAMVSA